MRPILRTKAIHAASQVIPQIEQENVHGSEARPYELPDSVSSQGNICLSAVLYIPNHDNAKWGDVRK
jgi:hypothetical protein